VVITAVYRSVRNARIATVLVLALAGILGAGVARLEAGDRAAVGETDVVHPLPEVEVTATRL
jgi:hypothetical protein